MLPNHMLLTKKAPEAGEPVGPIEVCCSDKLFGVVEEEYRRKSEKLPILLRGKLDTIPIPSQSV
jgi:hypothetical protein